jgi:hypothetical protein
MSINQVFSLEDRGCFIFGHIRYSPQDRFPLYVNISATYAVFGWGGEDEGKKFHTHENKNDNERDNTEHELSEYVNKVM